MTRFLNIMLLLLMSVVPMGSGRISACDVNSLIGLDRHHHEGELGAHSDCADEGTVPSPDDCDPVPCSDELVVTSSATALLRDLDTVVLQHFASATMFHLVMLPAAEDVYFIRHALYSPPHTKWLLSSSEFTGLYLI